MVIKEVREPNEEYLTRKAIKKKVNPLFSHAKTITSIGLQIAKNCKKIITKEEKPKLSFSQFDVIKE